MPINPVGEERLLKLADFLDELPPAKFDFNTIVRQYGLPMMEALRAGDEPCGTVGCAIGWMPAVFPEYLEWVQYHDEDTHPDVRLKEPYFSEACNQKKYGYGYDFGAARYMFDINQEEASYLFDPATSALGGKATPKEVAAHIRKFVSVHKETLSDATS